MVKKRSWYYLAGLFVSSLGSMTHAATLPVILFQLGVPAIFIGTLIGSMRINSFLVNTFLGHIGDKFNPKVILVTCEFGAAIGSLLIIFTWQHWGKSWLLPFAIANNIRVFFTALQAGSIQKLGKNFDTLLEMNGRFAVRISGATNGALLIGGISSLLLFDQLTVERLVLFDTATFLINGLLVLIAQKSSDHRPLPSSKKSISINIISYYKILPALALLDAILSLALSGSNTLDIRLLEQSPHLVPLMPTLFGGVAFICSLGFDRKFHPTSKIIWWLLGISLVIQGLVIDQPYLVLIISIFRNFAYWILYNSISREVMRLAPSDKFSSIASGRVGLSVSILALGEFWVGATKAIPIAWEMFWRGTLSILASIFRNKKNEI